MTPAQKNFKRWEADWFKRWEADWFDCRHHHGRRVHLVRLHVHRQAQLFHLLAQAVNPLVLLQNDGVSLIYCISKVLLLAINKVLHAINLVAELPHFLIQLEQYLI